MRVISSSTVILFFFSTLPSIHGAPHVVHEIRSTDGASAVTDSKTENSIMKPKIMVQPPREFRRISNFHSGGNNARDTIPQNKAREFHHLTVGYKGAARHEIQPETI